MKYRYEFTDTLGLVTSFSYAGDKNRQLTRYSDTRWHEDSVRNRWFSVMAGPSVRVNEWFSAYAMAGSATTASTKATEAAGSATAAAQSKSTAESAATRAETAAKRAEDIASAVALEDASTTKKGIVQLSSATNSTSESLAATPKAVKAAYDLAKVSDDDPHYHSDHIQRWRNNQRPVYLY